MPLQMSGKQGQTTTFATHIVRSHIRAAVCCNATCAVIFCDISAAYYAAVRGLTAGGSCARDFASICETLPISCEDKEELRRHLDEPSAMAQDGAEPWLQLLTAELNSTTWMALSGDTEGPVLTKRGTRPGSAFADITFGLMIKRVLACRDSLRPCSGSSPVPQLGWNGSRSFDCHDGSSTPEELPLSDIIWADDLATCLTSPDATTVAALVATESGCLDDAFSQHGLTLAFGAHKTAAICVVRGHGSREVRRKLFCGRVDDAVGVVPVLRESRDATTLPLVDCYKHLGVIHNAQGSVRQEIRSRIGQAWAAFREGCRRLYKSRWVDIQKRAVFLRSLVLSKLTVGAGAWPPLLDGEARMFQACVLGLYHQLVNPPRAGEQKWYACMLCARTGLLPPRDILHVERLRYALQMLRNGPAQLWALVRRDAAYCELMMSSFDWLYVRLQATCPLHSPRDAWTQWSDLMTTKPGRFKGWVKRASGLQQLETACMAEHAEFFQYLRDSAGCGPTVEADLPLSLCTDACTICRRAFRSFPCWASHAARKHGYRNPSTILAKGRTCLGCGKIYANVRRLKRHLDNSKICLREWGVFIPARKDDAQFMHVQAPPVETEGTFEGPRSCQQPLAICQPLRDTLQGLQEGSVFDVLGLLEGFCAPLRVIRNTVVEWSEGLPISHPLFAVSQDVPPLLHPEHLCAEVQPTRRRPPPLSDEPPSFGSLQAIPLILSGTCFCLSLPSPPSPLPTYPWSGYHTLKSAQQRALWTHQALHVCREAVGRAPLQPVCVHFPPDAACALPQACAWLQSCGFEVGVGGFGTPGFTRICC